MRKQAWLLGAVLSLTGCPDCSELLEGPGFYGKITLAGGSSSTAGAEKPAGGLALPIARAVRTLPSNMRTLANHVLADHNGTPRFSGPQKPAQREPLVEKWRPGQVIVASTLPQRRNLGQLTASLNTSLQPLQMTARLAACNEATTCLWKVHDRDGKLIDLEATRRAAEHMNTAREVRYAELNRIRVAMAEPNDEYRGLQWHYDLMNLPAAWDVTTGSNNVTVAVIDTGISYANPDFTGRLGSGVDLISEATISNDGDGRDNDPEDPGDDPAAGGGTFHGTHVAGTIGAASDNDTGVAGVSWQGVILPVRALGIGGGTDFDIAGGVRWAIGEDVEGVSGNDRPADVINMSLGGAGNSFTEEEAIEAAVSAGALVFVAAGNEDQDASSFTPANIEAAITVGAVNAAGSRASYSNFGSAVDVMAPGGQMEEDRTGDGYGDGVLSTLRTSYDFVHGTSMATPHVAGLGVLMKSLNPAITQEDAVAILKDTARTEDQFRCDECGGAALIDAASVVARLAGGANAPFLSVSPGGAFLAARENQLTVTVRNSGAGSLAWSAEFEGNPQGFSIDGATSGSLDSRQSTTLNVVLNRQARSGVATLLVRAPNEDNQDRRISLRYDEALSRKKPDVPEAIVGALIRKGEELEVANDKNGDPAARLAKRDDGFTFKLEPLDPNEYLIVGITDDNGNGQWEDGEGIGLYPDLADPKFVKLEEDQKLTDVNFVVRPTFLGGENTCPENSHADGENCICDSAFHVSDDGRSCVQ
ncbi:MAG: S8 family serine peptidase [Myxococcota bacterium]